MFETFVLVCLIGNTNICHTLSDIQGPYETKKQCEVRAYEIAVDLPDWMPNYEAVKYKCVKADDTPEGKMKILWQQNVKRVD
jgi:hypothetical protein